MDSSHQWTWVGQSPDLSQNRPAIAAQSAAAAHSDQRPSHPALEGGGQREEAAGLEVRGLLEENAVVLESILQDNVVLLPGRHGGDLYYPLSVMEPAVVPGQLQEGAYRLSQAHRKLVLGPARTGGEQIENV
jgi:hypothetical protein